MRGAALALALIPAAVIARPAPDADLRPSIVKLVKAKAGTVYGDTRGRTLYALNMRVANSRSGASLTYCIGPCQQVWAPLVAPVGAAAIGDWTILAGAQGPQWAYRGNLVFTFRADGATGALGGDGYDDLWTALRYVPPPPVLVAPASVAVRYVGDRTVLTDNGGAPLFVPRGSCDARCATWVPLAAGMAARSIGLWTVWRNGAEPQWAYRGKPVFVADATDAPGVPIGGDVLRP